MKLKDFVSGNKSKFLYILESNFIKKHIVPYILPLEITIKINYLYIYIQLYIYTYICMHINIFCT